MPSYSAHQEPIAKPALASADVVQSDLFHQKKIAVLIVVPTLDAGAAEHGAIELVRILTSAGHRAIVAARAGRLLGDITAAGGEFVPLDVASKNPFVMLRNARRLSKIVRDQQCDVIHALGRAGAWSACIAARQCKIPFVTGWYKGFREQNILKRLYNGVMARGDRVVATCDDIAQLVHDRYGTPWERLAVVPCSIDFDHFDPACVTRQRIAAMRRAWGVKPETRVILVTGRILRRKGHHVVVHAVKRLRDMGQTNFLCIFIGEDRGHTTYTGKLWDLALAHGVMPFVRMTAPIHDMPAAYAAASVVVSAAVQPEGVQRSILEAQAMGRPVIVSDLAAGPDVVLSAPSVPDSRVTGLRFPAGEDAALAAALLRLFSMPEPNLAAMGRRGREWVLDHFNTAIASERVLRLYGDLIRPQNAPPRAGIAE